MITPNSWMYCIFLQFYIENVKCELFALAVFQRSYVSLSKLSGMIVLYSIVSCFHASVFETCCFQIKPCPINPKDDWLQEETLLENQLVRLTGLKQGATPDLLVWHKPGNEDDCNSSTGHFLEQPDLHWPCMLKDSFCYFDPHLY